MVTAGSAPWWQYAMPLLPFAIAAMALLPLGFLHRELLVNALCQLTWFAVAAHMPAARTGRISYVDLAWPWGLCLIGVTALVMGEGPLAYRLIVALVYVVMGARMGWRSLRALRRGAFQREFNRYRYQRLCWRQQGKNSSRWAGQVEILSQALLNSTLLVMPALLLAETSRWTALTWLGLGLWCVGFMIEMAADRQKARFNHAASQRGLANAVCDTGLWRIVRHPNYLGEWIVWVGLALAAMPAAAFLSPDVSVGLSTSIAILVAVPLYMYLGLTKLTGIEPSEYYSRRSRPGYIDYCRRTPAFFPRLKSNRS